jgi:alpha-L-rhamnosidase
MLAVSLLFFRSGGFAIMFSFKKGVGILLTYVLLAGQSVPMTLSKVAAAEKVESQQVSHAPGGPLGLLTELLPTPLAVENLTDPKFSWKLNDEDKGEYQTAYQIQVGTDKEKIRQGIGDVWDSGKVSSDKSSGVSYGGSPLEPGKQYFWTVKVWDKDGLEGPYSKPSWFQTALKDAWTASPIWIGSDGAQNWQDYKLAVDVKIENVAGGIWFRAQNENNGYMWQLRADNNRLVPHVRKNGTWTVLKNVDLPFDIATGQTYHVEIEVNGSQFTTYINGQKVDVTTDTTHPKGKIGFRHGSTESAYYDNVRVTSTDGGSLLEQDFSAGSGEFPCGQVKNESLYVAKGVSCQMNSSSDWAFMRKEFQVKDKEITQATAYVTALSPEPAKQYVYRMSINGKFVGVGPTRSFNSSTFYNSFDVTNVLQKGKTNAIGVLAYTTQDQRFLSELHITYSDGTTDIIKTDNSWKGLNGSKALPAAGSIGTGYYAVPQENIQAASYPFGYSKPGFDDSHWSPVETKNAIPKLTALPTLNLQEETVKPVKIIDKGDGHYFLDFGQTVVGGIRLSVNGQKGQQVEIRLGEELQSPDTVRYQMRTGNTYKDVWTLREGSQVLQHWGYRVFRYAEIIGAPEALNETNVSAVALRYPFNQDASSFQSSNETLNQVWEFTKNSIRDLNHDLYLDSPTRERAPYEADTYIQQLSHYSVDQEYTLARLSNEYLFNNPTWPTEWNMFSVMSAYQDYLYTGDDSLLSRYYGLLKGRALDEYMTSEGLVKKSTTNDIVDWPDAMRDRFVFTTTNTVINAFNYRALSDLANIAGALGKTDDVTHYEDLAAKEKEGIANELFDTSVNHFRDGAGVNHNSEHANIFPVALGAADPDQAKKAAQYVADRGMVTSVYGAPFVLETLFRNGFDRRAVDLLIDDGVYSWKHMIDLGAGSTMEAWDPSQKINLTYSHAWAASPAYIVPRELFGIKPVKPAYEEFQVKPETGGITEASITVPTIRGSIQSSFKNDGNNFELSIDVPVNTKATVYIPAKNKWAVTVGQAFAHEAEEIKFLRMEDGFAVYSVGSGKYTLTSDAQLGKLGAAYEGTEALQSDVNKYYQEGRLNEGQKNHLISKTDKLLKQLMESMELYLNEDQNGMDKLMKETGDTIQQINNWVEVQQKAGQLSKEISDAITTSVSSIAKSIN